MEKLEKIGEFFVGIIGKASPIVTRYPNTVTALLLGYVAITAWKIVWLFL